MESTGFHSRSPAIPRALTQRQLPSAEIPFALDVGGTKFVTTTATLRRSEFFDGILSGYLIVQKDGSLFVDYDPEIFKHDLKYLRTGRLPSCFQGLDRGYDHELAADLKAAAAHFGIERLHEWLDKKGYLEVAKIMMTTTDFQLNDFATSLYSGDESVSPHVSWVAKDVSVCPQGIPEHVEGSVSSCGQACKKAAEKSSEMTSKQAITPAIVVVRKKVVFNDELCKPSDNRDTRKQDSQNLGYQRPACDLGFSSLQSAKEILKLKEGNHGYQERRRHATLQGRIIPVMVFFSSASLKSTWTRDSWGTFLLLGQWIVNDVRTVDCFRGPSMHVAMKTGLELEGSEFVESCGLRSQGKDQSVFFSLC